MTKGPRTTWGVSKTLDYLEGRLPSLIEEARSAGHEVTEEKIAELRANIQEWVNTEAANRKYATPTGGFVPLARALMVDDLKVALGLPADEQLQAERERFQQ